jgi:hypothetical protein
VSGYGILQRYSMVSDFARYERNNVPNYSHALGAGCPARAAQLAT